MQDQPSDISAPVRVRIWDPGLRLFHWALAVCVIAAWLLGFFGPSIMTLHFYLGYTVVGLLVFRVIWGLVGPRSARFAHFLYGPRATASYMAHLGRREPSYWPGHNPLGALSVFALLGVLAGQVSTGLIADPDDYINVGPLAGAVGSDVARKAAGWHFRLSFVTFALVVLHVLAVLFYRFWKRENLVRPMITGWKLVRAETTTTGKDRAPKA